MTNVLLFKPISITLMCSLYHARVNCIVLFAMDKERQSLERQQQEYISIKQSNDLNIICHNGL